MSRRAANGRAVALVVGMVAAVTLPASTSWAQTGANPTLRPWASTTDLPEGRSRLGAVFNDGFLYLLGGVGPNGVPATSTSFVAPVAADGTVGPWSTTTPLPGPRRTIRPAIWNDVIYLVGGNDGNNFQSTVYYARLNPDGTIGTWTGTTALPGPSTAHSTVAYNGYLYVVGGNTGTTCVNTVRYARINADGTLGAWATTSPLPGARCGNVEAVTVANGVMYAAGGYNNVDVTTAVFYAPINADGTLAAWQTNASSLTVPREYNGLEALNGFLYAIGGQADVSGAGGGSDVVEVAALNANGSVGPFSLTTSLPGDRGDLATEVIAGRVYAIGGGLGSSGTLPQSSVLFSSQAPFDAVPPAVSVTAPADGATVSGTIAVTATATDDNGVAGVQLLIDGTATGPEVTASPYTLPWNTVTAANGTHTITARARDIGGNLTTSAPVTVTVTNAADSGLLAAYGMETGSGTTLTDSSPNAANAELTDGTWTTAGRYGNAVTFNGTTTRARTAADLSLGSAFTLQAWVNNPTNEAYETILTVGTSRDLYLAGGQLSFYSDAISTTFGAIPTGSWQHVAVTYDGTTLRAYLNGVPLGAPQSATIAPVAAPLQSGAWIFGAANADYFSGTLDEVRVQSRALTEAELLVDLATPVVPPVVTPPTTVPPTTLPPTTVPPTSVLAAYGMETGSGTTLTDSSANAANAELTDGTWTTGRYGNAVAFNGTTTRARTAANVTLGSAFTLEAWVNNPTNEIYETIVTVGQERSLFLQNGQLGLDAAGTVVTLGPVPAAVWTHVAVAYDGTALQAYVDGVPLGGPQAIALAPVTGPLQIGAWIFGAADADYFSGTLDEVRVQDRALTQAEIQTDLATPVVPPVIAPGPIDPVPTTVPPTTTTTTTTTVPPTTTTTTTTVPPTTTTTTVPPPAGRVLAYGFSEGTGTAVASSFSGPTATVTGGTWAAGRYGSGVTFDGSTTRVRTDSPVTLGTTFTMEAWINNPAAQPYETVMTVGQNRNLYLRNGVLRFSTGATFVTFGSALPTAAWTHLAVTYDGTTMRAYANGVLLGTPQAIALAPVSAALQVGAWISGTGNFDYLSGAIDEVRLYDRALSPTEIQADLATPIG